MNWNIVLRKALVGLVATMAASGVAYLVATAQGLMDDPASPAWVIMVGPLVLHGLGLVSNIIKHWHD